MLWLSMFVVLFKCVSIVQIVQESWLLEVYCTTNTLSYKRETFKHQAPQAELGEENETRRASCLGPLKFMNMFALPWDYKLQFKI